jgi:hypothetical protein
MNFGRDTGFVVLPKHAGVSSGGETDEPGCGISSAGACYGVGLGC